MGTHRVLRVLPFVVFVLLVGAVGWQWSQEHQAAQEAQRVEVANSDVREYYSDGTFGFRFPYPASYVRKVVDDPSVEQVMHRSIILVAGNDADAFYSETPTDGPPAITVDVFTNALAATHSIADWVRQSPQSNFNISPDKQLADSTLGGLPAVRYRWSGLYEGESVAVALGQNILIASVSYRASDDAIRTDFENLLQGFFYVDPKEEEKGVL